MRRWRQFCSLRRSRLKRTPSSARRAFTEQAAPVRAAPSSPIGRSPHGATTALASASAANAFDIGSDTGTPVDDQDYQVPFAFTGKIDKLTFSIAPPALADEDKRKLMEAERAKQDAN
jgi:hypothetical protein